MALQGNLSILRAERQSFKLNSLYTGYNLAVNGQYQGFTGMFEAMFQRKSGTNANGFYQTFKVGFLFLLKFRTNSSKSWSTPSQTAFRDTKPERRSCNPTPQRPGAPSSSHQSTRRRSPQSTGFSPSSRQSPTLPALRAIPAICGAPWTSRSR